jgi:DNA-binding Lrp family transcriptional regulator
MNGEAPFVPDERDRALMLATQEGLPLAVRPYHALAERLGWAPEEVFARLARLRSAGVIRRIAAAPNHYALGYVANGMSVWDVDDERVDELGQWLAAQGEVSHCYRRPRALPLWRYNLFAMFHARERAEVERAVAVAAVRLAACFPGAVRAHEVLFSSRILKKTGVRLDF